MPESNKRYKKAKPIHPALHKTIQPFREFMRLEASGGTLLLLCIFLALIWVNLPIGWSYEFLWQTHVTFAFGSIIIDETLVFWINDLLMAIFFFLIGLEIKRELLIGWLSRLDQAAAPVIAAIGGMVVPALIYVSFNPPGTIGSQGWAIPMATDIAICLGILALFGSKIPIVLKVFLTTLAIADDIGSIIIIAIFYSHGIYLEFILLAIVFFMLLVGINRVGIRRRLPYLLGGVGFWFAVFSSGVHPTIAGVLLAMTIPATTRIDYEEFVGISSQLVGRIENIVHRPPEEVDNKLFLNATRTLEYTCQDAATPLQRLETSLAPWVVFLIVPLFAIANAGVRIDMNPLELLGQPVALGIVVGLVLGKPLGVIGSTWIASKLGIAKLSESVTLHLLIGVAFLTGIGFTISMFIATMSFQTAQIAASAKLGILVASSISAVLGILWLKFTMKEMAKKAEANRELVAAVPETPYS